MVELVSSQVRIKFHFILRIHLLLLESKKSMSDCRKVFVRFGIIHQIVVKKEDSLHWSIVKIVSHPIEGHSSPSWRFICAKGKHIATEKLKKMHRIKLREVAGIFAATYFCEGVEFLLDCLW